MRLILVWALALAVLVVHGSSGAPAEEAAPAPKLAPARFTPMAEAPVPKIVASSEAYPGGRFEAANLLDGDPRTEYSSHGKGTETFVDLDFGRAIPLAGFRHLDRNDPATVGRSRLVFSDGPDFAKVLGTVEVEHAAARGADTWLAFAPVTARYARWQITAVGPDRYGTVGGAELGFFTAGPAEPSPSRIEITATAVPALVRSDGGLLQPIEVSVRYPYAEPAEAAVSAGGAGAVAVKLSLGVRPVALPPLPAVDKDTPVEVTVQAGAHAVARKLVLRPVRPWSLYLLPHSHVDIGYTHVQTEVERMQWRYLDEAVELARRTADYPPEARFRWNVEVMWAVESYLKQAAPEKRKEFIEAVRQGRIGLDALYGNQLTALCRPEELFRLLDCARRVSWEHGLTVDSAMLSDVPGATWGIVPALAQSGVRYFSMGPNHCHRIGHALAEWGDRPFWWVSPSGQEKVLCWMAGRGYSWFHPGLLGPVRGARPEAFFEYLRELERSAYPYDMVQLRYSIGGDNGPPDPGLPDFVKAWNEKYDRPRMVISTTGEMMREFERRYGEKLPAVRGDFTPYWEDGAASSARETALARNAAERLAQAEALWAMLDPRGWPDADFSAAWRKVLLYNEHTWGAHSSITRPDDPFTLDQWKIKQAHATDADAESHRLLGGALAGVRSGTEPAAVVDVFNTCSWTRTDLVVLPREMKLAGDAVAAPDGKPVPSQRLSTGQLAFLAEDVPGLGARRFLLRAGAAKADGSAAADALSVRNEEVRATADPNTGAIAYLAGAGLSVNLAAARRDPGLNVYQYVPGRDPKQVQPAGGPAKIVVTDRGPLVASLAVETGAPGCRRLVRQVRVVHGLDHVDLTNIVDKERVLAPESVHFRFALNVPDGEMRMDVPWAVVRPEHDQIPGACKNYFTVGRWIDVSNEEYGVTWATADAPLAEVGAIRVDVPSPFGAEGWIQHLPRSQTLFSYVMNNYWETNYKASQEGPHVFRYALRPHGRFHQAAAARFGAERSRPLVVTPADPGSPLRGPMLRVGPEPVVAATVKPSADGKALIVRLFNTGQEPAAAAVAWLDPKPARVTLSSPFEEPGTPVEGPIEMPPLAIVTLRAELP